ncbi:hypothetical protein M885DRAFT_573998 [Pelagophyceae sp. CCMP2097]|nr:hypothetical protein M885DRAFT_573998 [Pelagophyceae sp. CCMP2097]
MDVAAAPAPAQSSRWRIRSLSELAARKIVAVLAGDPGDAAWAAVAAQLLRPPATVLEALWSHAAETDRLSDGMLEALCGGGASQLEALELGRIPLGVTERGLVRAAKVLPAFLDAVRVGWPAHFGGRSVAWLTAALHERAAAGGRGLRRIDVRAAGPGGAQGGAVPRGWARGGFGCGACGRDGDGDGDGMDDADGPRAAGRPRAPGDAAALAGVNDGDVKCLLRAVKSEHAGLEAFCVAGAAQAEGRFADTLAECAPCLRELRFRDAPAVTDDACAALVKAVAPTLERLDFSNTRLGNCGALVIATAVPNLVRLNLDRCAEIDDASFDVVCRGAARLRELSARHCARLTAGGVWLSVATHCADLERLRCDLRKAPARGGRRARPGGAGHDDADRAGSDSDAAGDAFADAVDAIGAPRNDGEARRRLVVELLAESPLAVGSAAWRDLEASLRASLGAFARGGGASSSSLDDAASIASIAELPPFDAKFRGTKLKSLRVALVGAPHGAKWLSALLDQVPNSLCELEVRAAWGGERLAEPLSAAAAYDLEAIFARCIGLDRLALSLDRLDAAHFHRLEVLNASWRGFGAAEARALFADAPRIRLVSVASDGRVSADDVAADAAHESVVIRAPKLESLRLEGVNLRGRDVVLDRCRALERLSLRRCSLGRVSALDARAAPRLQELALVECRDLARDAATAAPGDFAALRRLAAPSDAYAAAFVAALGTAAKSTVARRTGLASIRALTLDESAAFSTGPNPATATAVMTLGAALLARAAAAAAYLGTPAFDGLVALELICARELTCRHVAALPLACPALARLRLVGCRGLRGALAATSAAPRFPGNAAAASREDETHTPLKGGAASESDAGFDVDASGASDDDADADDCIFELDDGGTGGRRSTPQQPRPASSVRFSATVDPEPRRRASEPAVAARRRRPGDAESQPEAALGPNRNLDFDALDESAAPDGAAGAAPDGAADGDRPSRRGSGDHAPTLASQRRRVRAASDADDRGKEGTKQSAATQKRRYDALLQCHVGCSRFEAGTVAQLMRALGDARSDEYRERRRYYAKLALQLPRDKAGGPRGLAARAACARHLAGNCARRAADCEYAHVSAPKIRGEKKLRPLFDLLADVDAHVGAEAGVADASSWPPARGRNAPGGKRQRQAAADRRRRSGSHSPADDEPEDVFGSLESSASLPRDGHDNDSDDDDAPGRSPPAAASPVEAQRRGRATQPQHVLVFLRLEALDVDGCDGVVSLRVVAPRLLALLAPRCDRLATIDAFAPRLTHLDVRRCASLAHFALPPKSLVALRVASVAYCAALPETFLHRLVDHCRFLVHLDVYGVVSDGKGASASKKKNRGADPHRVKQRSRAGLDKLNKGRPDLDVVRSRKEHEAPGNAARTTMDLALADVA